MDERKTSALLTSALPGATSEEGLSSIALKGEKNPGAFFPEAAARRTVAKRVAVEKSGPSGLEPTRYGDWERKGRCIDF